MPTIEPKPGDILVPSKDGQLYWRSPTRWERVRDRVVWPVLRVLLAPVILVVLIYQDIKRVRHDRK